MKKIENMSPSQIKYETKRAIKKGMTLNEWINHHNEKDNITVYHYTKGLHLDKILGSGVLKKESKLCPIEHKGNPYSKLPTCLWLTTDNYYPPCSLPTLINETGKEIGRCPSLMNGVYRFSFKVKDFNSIKKFTDTKLIQQLENKKFRNNTLLEFFKDTAFADTDNWYVSGEELPIQNMTIEVLKDSTWTEMETVNISGDFLDLMKSETSYEVVNLITPTFVNDNEEQVEFTPVPMVA